MPKMAPETVLSAVLGRVGVINLAKSMQLSTRMLFCVTAFPSLPVLLSVLRSACAALRFQIVHYTTKKHYAIINRNAHAYLILRKLP